MNNIDKLVQRSKKQLNLKGISSVDNGDKVVPVTTNKYFDVIPIWIDQVDDIEGPIYSDFICLNPWYSELYIRQAVKTKLELASSYTPEDWRLIVRAGHRPLAVQYRLLEMVSEDYLIKNPQASSQDSLEYARTYVSDPSIKNPPHCCGAAVDVDVVNKSTGMLVDFGTPVNTDSELSFLHSETISIKQKLNRMSLLKLMLKAGFAPFYHEWWHFSYGDQAWASFYDKPQAIYDIVDEDDLKKYVETN